MTELYSLVPNNVGTFVSRRALLGLLGAEQDAKNPTHGAELQALVAGPDSKIVDFVAILIEENQKDWDALLDNEFCKKMGNGTASLDGFRYYMIQDLHYLRAFVKYKLRLYAKAEKWDDVKQAADSIPNDVKYADDQLNALIKQLGLTEKQIFDAPVHDDVQDYINYEALAAQEYGWFDLHILLLPCIIGYYEISKRLDAASSTLKGTVYYDQWIKPNNGGSSAQKYRDFVNMNVDDYASSEKKKEWSRIFGSACKREIKVFNTGLQKVDPSYEIIKPGNYYIKNVATSTVAGLENGDPSEGTPVIGVNKKSVDSQKWILALTGEGYTLQNKASETYASLSAMNSSGYYFVEGHKDPFTWYINPYAIYGGKAAYHLIVNSKQNFVMDLAESSKEEGTKILAYPNYNTTNQAWVFEDAGDD